MNLKDNATHVSKIRGKLSEKTDPPIDNGVAGLQPGHTFYNTSNDALYIRTSTSWKTKALTTTSTSTS
jgi:hypothetical protein